MNGEIRDRERVMRTLEKADTPILPGMQVFHNYVRPHEALKGRTPSEAAGIEVKGENKWMTHTKCKQEVSAHLYLYARVCLSVDRYMGKCYIVLSDEIERKLRLAAVVRLGGKKGDLSEAIELAISDWLKKDWKPKD